MWIDAGILFKTDLWLPQLPGRGEREEKEAFMILNLLPREYSKLWNTGEKRRKEETLKQIAKEGTQINF